MKKLNIPEKAASDLPFTIQLTLMKKLITLIVALFVLAVFPREASAGPRFHVSIGVPVGYHYVDYRPVYARPVYGRPVYYDSYQCDSYRPRYHKRYRNDYRASRYYDDRHYRPVRKVYRTSYYGH